MHMFAKPLIWTALTALVWTASASGSQAQTLVPGYYNPRTNTFHPRLNISPAAGGTSHTGTIDVTVGVTLISSIPSGQQVQCDVTVTATDTSGDFSEVISNVAATVSDKTASCTTAIPYELTLSGTASYTVSVTVIASGTTAAYRDVDLPGTATATLPANGTTTKVSFQTVL